MEQKDLDLYKYILNKDEYKRKAYKYTLDAFNMLRTDGRKFIKDFEALRDKDYPQAKIRLSYADRGDTEFMLRFSSDVLLFSVHTNIFEFSRNHEVMKTPYVKEDPERSFCGVIHIYNFLADSIHHHRENDLGYLIGRVFINKDNHYFIEGKQELGLFFTRFGYSSFDAEASLRLIRSAVEYTAKFDLLTPPYDEIKQITVGMVEDEWAYKRMTTAKRLGFQFKADEQKADEE